MKFAYADPPYLGCCGRYDHFHPDGKCWDDLATHVALIQRLQDEYPEGWALSLSLPSLRHLLPACPEKARVAAWVKPFAHFKPGVNPAYAWEPVIWAGGRTFKERGGKSVPTARDWHSESIRMTKPFFFGAKPKGFGAWIAELLGATNEDEIADLFPGSGAVTDSIAQRGLFVS